MPTIVTPARPTAVRWIIALTRVRLFLSLILIVASIAFMSPFDSEVIEKFRTGWVRGTGFDVSEYGPEEAGEVAGAAAVPAAVLALMLYFIRRRKLKALRVAATVSAVLAIGHFVALVLSISTLILVFRDSTRAHMGDPPRRAGEPLRA